MVLHGHVKGSVLGLTERLRDSPVQLRWGGPMVAGAVNGQCHLLNGLEQLQRFKDAGVETVDFTARLLEARLRSRTELLLGRKLNHTQGKDIKLVAQRRWEDSDYWTLYVPAVWEWRVHILNGKSIARGLKVWAGEGPELATHPKIRSRRLGWRLNHKPDLPKIIREAAKAAVAAVGYDLAAVDILQTEDGPVVLECNSRPAIRDEYTLTQYTKALGSL